MGVLRLIDIETRDHHFTVVLCPATSGGYEARFWSTPRDPGKTYSRVEQQISDTFRNENADSALYMAVARIESADGPVLRLNENLLDGHSMSFIPRPRNPLAP